MSQALPFWLNPALADPLEDERRRLLAEQPSPAARKRLVIEWYQYGLIDEAQVEFWFYVFGLADA